LKKRLMRSGSCGVTTEESQFSRPRFGGKPSWVSGPGMGV